MQSNWDNAFKLLLASEGGFVNHPSDPGGMTNLGVTKATWENWIGRQSDEAEMRSLTPQKVEPLYKKKYWNAVRGDELDAGIDYILFDFAVNAGAFRCVKTIQRALNITADGVIGHVTLKAIQETNAEDFINNFSAAKETFYRSLNNFPTFGKGWLNRVAEAKKTAEGMLG